VISQQDKLNLQKKFEIVDSKPAGWIGHLKLDPSIFSYNFFRDTYGKPMSMLPHQDLILNDPSQLRLLNLARGAGKSTIAAIEAIFSAYWNDNYLVLIMSNTEKQAFELIRTIKDLMKTSNYLTWEDMFPKGRKENKTGVEIKNPNKKTFSRIVSVPATDAARGYSPNLIICDELAFWDNPAIFKKVVLGMLHRIDGKFRRILALSTPNGRKGPFWDCYNSTNWSVYDFDWHINPYITESQMKDMRESMTELEFKSEYGAKFVSSRDSYFTEVEIQNAISSEANQGYKGELGTVVSVDFGKIHDKCVIDIGHIINLDKPKNEQIVRLIDHRVKPLGTDYATIIAELISIHRTLKPVKFILDATGVGEGPSDVLISQGVPVELFKFSLFSKVSIMNNLKILMQNKRIQIPDDKELVSQLEVFEYRVGEHGIQQPRLHAPDGYYDDEVDALALLAWGLTKTGFNYVSFVDRPSAAPTDYDDFWAKVPKPFIESI